VTLIRHAYVRTAARGKGIGSRLLEHLRTQTARPTLVGTWAAATWAVKFYEKHGFRLVTWEQKGRLLRKYWSIPERQTETSVVLADACGERAWKFVKVEGEGRERQWRPMMPPIYSNAQLRCVFCTSVSTSAFYH